MRRRGRCTFVSSGGGVCVSKGKIEAVRAGRRVVSTTEQML